MLAWLGRDAPTLESTVLACRLLNIPRRHVPSLALLGAEYVGGYRREIMGRARRGRNEYHPSRLQPTTGNRMPPQPVEGGIEIAEWS